MPTTDPTDRRLRHRRQSGRDSRKGRAARSRSASGSSPCFSRRPVLRDRRPVPAHGRIARRRLSGRRRRRHLPVARLAVLRPRRQMGRQPAPRRRYVRSPRRSATKSKSADATRRERGEGETRRGSTRIPTRVSLSTSLFCFAFFCLFAFSPLGSGFFASSAFFSPAGVTLTSIFWSIFCCIVWPPTVASIVTFCLQRGRMQPPLLNVEQHLAVGALLGDLHLHIAAARRLLRLSRPAAAGLLSNSIFSCGLMTAYVVPSISFVPS